MIYELGIAPEILDIANKRIQRLNIKRRDLSKFGSERERILIGYIGEQLVMQFLGIKHLNDEPDYDVMYDSHRLEVKSISCKFKPLPDFLCTVNSYDLNGVHKQDADFYIFTRIRNDKKVGWILGFIGCKDFFGIGTFIEKGTTIAGVKFSKANATVILISQLTSL